MKNKKNIQLVMVPILEKLTYFEKEMAKHAKLDILVDFHNLFMKSIEYLRGVAFAM